MYHERQYKSYCRCHALNNLLGKKCITPQEFDAYCDAYDNHNKFLKGSSRNNFVFYNNGGNDNIFGYVLEKKQYSVKMKHFDFHKTKKLESPNDTTIGYIVFNTRHTYCVAYRDSKLYLIDSLRSRIQEVSKQYLTAKNMGVIQVDLMK